MKRLLTLILLFSISFVYAQVKTQTLNKKESKELLKVIDTKTDSDYDGRLGRKMERNICGRLICKGDFDP